MKYSFQNFQPQILSLSIYLVFFLEIHLIVTLILSDSDTKTKSIVYRLTSLSQSDSETNCTITNLIQLVSTSVLLLQ